MKTKILESLEDVEFELFKEIKPNGDIIEGDISNKLEDYFDGENVLLRVIKILDGKVIGHRNKNRIYSKNEYYLFENLHNSKENDILLVSVEGFDIKNVFCVKEEVCNLKFLHECSEKIYGIPKPKEKIITRKIILKLIDETIKKDRDEEKTKEELEKGEKVR